jgi:hypothetical protein
LLLATATATLKNHSIEKDSRSAVSVVMASGATPEILKKESYLRTY